MKAKNLPGLIAGAVVLVLAGLFVYSNFHAPAAVGSLASAVKLTGEVQAARTLRAYPDTAGRVIEVVSAGTLVAAGDVVARVDPSRPVSRSKRVLLSLSGDLSRVEPGMFAEVELSVSRSASALLIPLEAVVRRGSSDLVYVVSDGVARERPVRLGRFSETGAEVLEGVAEGEVVVVRGQNLIRDGSRVSVAEGRR